MGQPASISRFAKFAWGVLAYNLVVVAWGAYVRATGSGAGCGGHWPLCNGEVIPRSPSTQTLIEYTHRLSSGLVLIMSLALLVWAFLAHEKGHPARLGAVAAVFFTITEALLGAALVLFGLVADNASTARAFVMPIHLTNTFLLLAAFALCAFWASGGPLPRLVGRGRSLTVGGIALLGVLILGVSGAVTALGDTLYPPGTLREGLAQDLAPTTSILLRLRIFHPLIACGAAFLFAIAAGVLTRTSNRAVGRSMALAVLILFGAQFLIGIANVLLLAPVWLQLIHLFLADLIWVGAVLLVAASLDPTNSPPSQMLPQAAPAAG